MIISKLNLKKEKQGWINLIEKSTRKIWNNKKDKKIWDKYLKIT